MCLLHDFDNLYHIKYLYRYFYIIIFYNNYGRLYRVYSEFCSRGGGGGGVNCLEKDFEEGQVDL